eukprot:2041286-Prymnesium_polylepis.1
MFVVPATTWFAQVRASSRSSCRWAAAATCSGLCEPEGPARPGAGAVSSSGYNTLHYKSTALPSRALQ